MRSIRYILLALYLSSTFACSFNKKFDNTDNIPDHKHEAVKVIFDTDMCFDVDDVAALSILHAYQSKGKAKILAVVFSEVHKDGAAAIAAINTYYGRGNIPVGVYKDPLFKPDYSKYLTALSEYPNNIPSNPNKIKSAVEVYVEALKDVPDNSVTIICVGFLNNLADFLEQQYDLIAKKVNKLVIMGGISGDDFNFVRHNLKEDTEKIFEQWPTLIVISQFGEDVLTGKVLEKQEDSPVREAFYQWFDHEFHGRSSWDSFAVLYAIDGRAFFDEKWDDTINIKGGKSFPMSKGKIHYITPILTSKDYQKIIDNMLCQK